MGTATYSFRATASFTEHDRAVDKARAKVKDYKKEVDSARTSTEKLSKQNFSGAYQSQRRLQTTVKNTTNVLQGLNGNLMGAIGKFGPYAAAAAAAIGAASSGIRKVISQSDEWSDKFEGTMKGLNAVVNRFAYSIGTMDFSNFWNGLKTAYRNAKDLYDAMDNLETLKIIQGDEIEKYRVRLEQARTEVRQAQADGDANALAVAKNRMEAASKLYVGALRKMIPEIETAKEKTIKAALDWDNNKYYSWESPDAVWNEIRKLKTQDNSKRIKELEESLAGMSPILQHNLYASTKRELQLLEMANKITDDQLKQVSDLNRQRNEINTKIAETLRQDVRYNNLQSKTDSTLKVPVSPVFPEGSIAYLQQQLNEKEAALKLAITDEDRANIMTQIDSLQEQIAEKLDPIPDGSIAQAEKKLKDLQDKFQLAPTAADRADIQKAIDETQRTIDLMNGKVEIPIVLADPEPGSIRDLQNRIVELKRMIENTSDVELRMQLVLDMDKLQTKLNTLNNALKTPTQAAEENSKALQDTWNSDLEALDHFGGMVGDVFDGISSSMDDVAAKQTQASGQIIQSILNMIPAILKLIGAKQAEALASGTASAAKVGFPANIGAIATIVAQLTSVFSAISALTSTDKYASGGIIDGAKRLGDMNIARVNNGEMILNNQQQTRLFRILNGIGLPNQDTSGGQVQFRISGGDLVGVLKNYNTVNKRIR